MKIETTHLSAKPVTFLGLFLLGMVAFFSIGAIIENFASTSSFGFKFNSPWKYVFFALANAIGLTLATRKLQLTISDTSNLENIKDRVFEFLLDNGVKAKETTESKMTLEPVNKFNRMLNNWFGTEVISVSRISDKLIVEGPFRHIDRLKGYVDSKLRFGVPKV